MAIYRDSHLFSIYTFLRFIVSSLMSFDDSQPQQEYHYEILAFIVLLRLHWYID